jgi:hypothetical protein
MMAVAIERAVTCSNCMTVLCVHSGCCSNLNCPFSFNVQGICRKQLLSTPNAYPVTEISGAH